MPAMRLSCILTIFNEHYCNKRDKLERIEYKTETNDDPLAAFQYGYIAINVHNQFGKQINPIVRFFFSAIDCRLLLWNLISIKFQLIKSSQDHEKQTILFISFSRSLVFVWSTLFAGNFNSVRQYSTSTAYHLINYSLDLIFQNEQ